MPTWNNGGTAEALQQHLQTASSKTKQHTFKIRCWSTTPIVLSMRLKKPSRHFICVEEEEFAKPCRFPHPLKPVRGCSPQHCWKKSRLASDAKWLLSWERAPRHVTDFVDWACSSHFQTLRSCYSVKAQKPKYVNENQSPQPMALAAIVKQKPLSYYTHADDVSGICTVPDSEVNPRPLPQLGTRYLKH